LVSKPKVPHRFRFSKEKIAALPVPTDGPAVYYDSDVKGLCLRIQPSGNAVFFVLKKVAGKTYRKTLGDGNLALEAARKHAHTLLGKVADWLAGDRKDTCPMLRPLDDSKLTFQEAFEMYLKAPRKREQQSEAVTNRERAEERLRELFDRYLAEIGAKPVDELGGPQGLKLVGSLHQRLTKKFGPIAANRAHEVLRATFNHLVAKGLWTTTNPSRGATRNPKKEAMRILEAEELKPFFDALDADENRMAARYFALLFAIGPRKRNLYAAEWAEFSLSRKIWTIPAEKSKSGKEMVLPLKREAIVILREMERQRKDGCPFLFPSQTSASKHVEDYSRQFTRILKRAGIKNFTFHSLRRSFIAYNLMSGAPMPVVSAAAGHINLDSMKPYARFTPGAVPRALEMGEEEIQKRMAEAEAEKKQQGRAQLTA
jgi:integrase